MAPAQSPRPRSSRPWLKRSFASTTSSARTTDGIIVAAKTDVAISVRNACALTRKASKTHEDSTRPPIVDTRTHQNTSLFSIGFFGLLVGALGALVPLAADHG